MTNGPGVNFTAGSPAENTGVSGMERGKEKKNGWEVVGGLSSLMEMAAVQEKLSNPRGHAPLGNAPAGGLKSRSLG